VSATPPRRRPTLRPLALTSRRDALWTAIRTLAARPDGARVAEVAGRAGVGHAVAVQYMRPLARVGILEAEPGPPGKV